jgi:AbrB family looped-hinge helix DNA binding protein
MRTTIDRSGRVVIPRAIRRKLGLDGGESLEVEERDGSIELRPATAEVRIVDTPEGPVATASGPMPQLTDEQVREVLEQVRR